jgi:hypothetical protein
MLACPRCGVEKLRRLRARGLERIFRTLSSYRKYRCSDCEWRGWLPTGEGPWLGIFKRAVRAILLLVIIILTAVTAWLITKAVA